MQRCKTCRHWRAEDGRCERIEEGSLPMDSSALAIMELKAADDWNLSGTFRTAPNFGCVLHELDPKR